MDVRVVAATNRDLEAAVKQGGFREDLYFRLNVVPIEVPPLRNRKSDVPLLIRHFLSDLKKGPQEFVVAPGIYDRLMKYDWPGNVRELRNLVERAVVLDSPDLLGQVGSKLSQIPEPDPPPMTENPWMFDEQITYKEAKQSVLDTFEQKFFEQRLRQNKGNVSRTAETLGMHRKNLQEKLDRLGINPKEVPDSE